jgi:hypothetical protein
LIVQKMSLFFFPSKEFSTLKFSSSNNKENISIISLFDHKFILFEILNRHGSNNNLKSLRIQGWKHKTFSQNLLDLLFLLRSLCNDFWFEIRELIVLSISLSRNR